MRIAYITAHAPFGKIESFVLQEVLEIQRRGHDVFVIPRNPPKEILHKAYFEQVAPRTFRIGLFSLPIWISVVRTVFQRPSRFFSALAIIFHSRNLPIALKNLSVFPKAAWIAEFLKKQKIEHLHAHWGSTPSSMAMMAAKLADVPWSLTIHRFGLWEKNLLPEKVRSAAFIRCISEKSRRDLLEIVGTQFWQKIHVIHVGIQIPERFVPPSETVSPFILATPANLVPVKGHVYLVRAVERLIKQAGLTNIKAIFWGDGPLRKSIQNTIDELGLNEHFELPGAVPHPEIIRAYRESRVHAVVLPSIVTKNGIHEGIPTALMEAMAYGVPVISTNTGSISELLSEGRGLLVPEKDPDALAGAILQIYQNSDLRKKLSEFGYARVRSEYNIQKIGEKLIALFIQNLKSGEH